MYISVVSWVKTVYQNELYIHIYIYIYVYVYVVIHQSFPNAPKLHSSRRPLPHPQTNKTTTKYAASAPEPHTQPSREIPTPTHRASPGH